MGVAGGGKNRESASGSVHLVFKGRVLTLALMENVKIGET